MTEPATHQTKTPTLTPREREVLRLIAAGRSNTEIAQALGMSFPTAKTHVSNILSKLKVDSREEAARWWDAHGKDSRPSVFASWSRRFGIGWGWRPIAIAGGVAAVSGVAVVALLVALVAADDEDRAAGLAPGMWVAGLDLDTTTWPRNRVAAIQLHHSETGELFTVGEPREYLQLMLAPDGRHVAGWYFPEEVREREDEEEFFAELAIFSLPDGEETIVVVQPAYRILWSPDGTRLALFGMGGVDIFSADGDLLGSVHREATWSVRGKDWAWAPDSSMFALLGRASEAPPAERTILIVGRDGDLVATIDDSEFPMEGQAFAQSQWLRLDWDGPSTIVLLHQGFDDQEESPARYNEWLIHIGSDGATAPGGLEEPPAESLLDRSTELFGVVQERYPGSITFCDYCYARHDGLYHLGFWYSPSVNLRDAFTEDPQDFAAPRDTESRIAILDADGGIQVIETGMPPVPGSGGLFPPYDLALVERP